MTARTPLPKSWDAHFAALQQRFPSARGNTLVALHIVAQQPDVTLEDARARAAMFGTSISFTHLQAARRLLNPKAAFQSTPASPAVVAAMRTPARASEPTRQPEPAVDAEKLIRTIVGRLQNESAVEARRLNDAVQVAVATLRRALGTVDAHEGSA